MAGKQAKILTRQQIIACLRQVRHSRYPQRDRVMILLSVKAGLPRRRDRKTGLVDGARCKWPNR